MVEIEMNKMFKNVITNFASDMFSISDKLKSFKKKLCVGGPIAVAFLCNLNLTYTKMCRRREKISITPLTFGGGFSSKSGLFPEQIK